MNAKKAKALRKVLRNMVAEHPEPLAKHDFTTIKGTQKEFYTEKEDENGAKTVEKIRVFDGQVRVAPRSQRAVYLHLKKEMEKVSK